MTTAATHTQTTEPEWLVDSLFIEDGYGRFAAQFFRERNARFLIGTVREAEAKVDPDNPTFTKMWVSDPLLAMQLAFPKKDEKDEAKTEIMLYTALIYRPHMLAYRDSRFRTKNPKHFQERSVGCRQINHEDAPCWDCNGEYFLADVTPNFSTRVIFGLSANGEPRWELASR